MVWFFVEDNLTFHKKALQAGNAAMGLWVRAGSLCAQQLTDGFITEDLARTIGGKALIQRLIDAELWLPVDGGYEFHQWAERQPTKARVEEQRKAARLRKEKWRDARNAAVTPSGTRDGTQDEHVSEHGTNSVRNATPTRASGDASRVTTPSHTKPSLTTLAPASGAERQRPTDDLFEAVVAACGIDAKDLTPAGRGPLNNALKQLREVDATPGQVQVRARRYRAQFPQASLTPAALAKHWASLTSGQPAERDPGWDTG
jgi:hypothetical protein